MIAMIVLGGCRWPVTEQPYASDVAQPTEADLANPPETRALACTDSGFTLVVGPDPGCASLEGIFGRGTLRPGSIPFAPPPGIGTPLRVVRRGDRVVDVEVAIRCREFFNDAPDVDVRTLFAASCRPDVTSTFQNSCLFSPRFEATLRDSDVLELELVGEGAVADFHACARPDP